MESKELWEGANEFLLFHGSCPAAMDSICDGNFKESCAGAAGLYGPGFYFAEACSKADEYSSDDKDGIYKGLYAMLLCRVTCGACLYSDEVKPDSKSLLSKVGPRGNYHAVLGDREKARGTYREFVVYDKDQVYPEYVVIYRRSTV